jgi:hypothetical protein
MATIVFLTFVACNSDDAVVVVSNSSDGLPLTAGLIFKICCIRESLTSGYSDGALFIEGQKRHIQYNCNTI